MNDEKEARELDALTARYCFMQRLKAGKRKGWWAWVSDRRLDAKLDTTWREMLLRIPVDHYIEIDNILQQSNIAHYGNS